MNLFSLLLFVLNAMACAVVGTEFGTVTDSPQYYLHQLYLQEWNEDKPSDLDETNTNAAARAQVCDDIIRSGVFEVYARHGVSFSDAYCRMMREPSKYDSILQRFCGPTKVYKNSYYLQEFPVLRFLPGQPNAEPALEMKQEYTFPCFLREGTGTPEDPDHIVVFFVSKVYNIHRGLWAHRFVFHELPDESMDIMLAEKSADNYTRPDFNVELHYLELRKHHKPASTCGLDPVCKYALNDTASQIVRLCEIVFSSSYFRKRFNYPQRVHNHRWFKARISFRTEEGRRTARTRKYFEMLMSCMVTTNFGYLHTFYISRAYNPHQVFVYSIDERDHKLYLESLSVNVSIVHERYGLGDIEI